MIPIWETAGRDIPMESIIIVSFRGSLEASRG